MSISWILFGAVWGGLVVLLALAMTVGRWLRFRDDVVELARRDRRRAKRVEG